MQLMVNANTVAKAYNELSSQGLVESKQGLGLFVAPQRQILSDGEQRNKLDKAISTFVNDVAYLDFSDQEILNALSDALSEIVPGNTEQGD